MAQGARMARIKKEMETALQEKEKVAAKAQKKAAKLGDQSGEFGSPGGSSPEKSKTKEKRLRAIKLYPICVPWLRRNRLPLSLHTPSLEVALRQ